MLNLLDAEHVMISLYEILCDSYFSRETPFVEGTELKELGIHFAVELRADNHGYEKDGNTHHESWERRIYNVFHVIILQNRRVYTCLSKHISLHEIKAEEFKNKSNHDSCYRSDGLHELFKIVGTMFDEAYSHVPKAHQPKHYMAGVNGNLTPMLRKAFRYVRVKRKPLPHKEGERWDNYFDMLDSIQEVDFKIQIIEKENGKKTT